MAVTTYQFDMDATYRSEFVTDSVADTTTVRIVNKSNSNVVAQFDIILLDALLRNRTEWNALKGYNDLLGFTKV